MSTITRHLQIQSFPTIIQVLGDSRLVKEFGKRFQREKFPCDYKEQQGNHESMIATITPQGQGVFYTQYNHPRNNDFFGGYELQKMEIIHILEDEGFKIISTMFDAETKIQRIMMYKELQQ